MSQNNSVDMSQYRQQQQLLAPTSAQHLRPNLYDQHPQLDQQTISQSIPDQQHASQSDINNQHIHDAINNQINPGSDDAGHPGIPVSINVNPPPEPRDPYRIFRVLLDYAILLIFVYKYFSTGTTSKFAVLWLGAYFIHILAMKSCREIKRSYVAGVFACLAVMWLVWGFSSINNDMRLFMLAYLIEVIPFILGCMCACCIASCTCACATCCICWYAFASTRTSIFSCVQKIRFRKLKDQLCNQQLTIVDDRVCPICLQIGDQMNTLNCHHSFHPKCLSAWIDAHKTCPVCRTALY